MLAAVRVLGRRWGLSAVPAPAPASVCLSVCLGPSPPACLLNRSASPVEVLSHAGGCLCVLLSLAADGQGLSDKRMGEDLAIKIGVPSIKVATVAEAMAVDATTAPPAGADTPPVVNYYGNSLIKQFVASL